MLRSRSRRLQQTRATHESSARCVALRLDSSSSAVINIDKRRCVYRSDRSQLLRCRLVLPNPIASSDDRTVINLHLQITVLDDGTIAVPLLIERVPAAGLNISQLNADLSSAIHGTSSTSVPHPIQLTSLRRFSLSGSWAIFSRQRWITSSSEVAVPLAGKTDKKCARCGGQFFLFPAFNSR